MRIDDEPAPRNEPHAWQASQLQGPSRPLDRHIVVPEQSFIEVLIGRSSKVGGQLTWPELSSVLWHSMLLRERRPSARFGRPWESRNTPSAGGLHPLRLLCLPLSGGHAGLHDPDAHALTQVEGDGALACKANRESVRSILGDVEGTTLQIVADPSKTAACYENAESLVLRDAGALVSVICLVATSLNLSAVPLGRAGTSIVRASGLKEPLVGVGAVHLSGA
jgi:hypothetical protein